MLSLREKSVTAITWYSWYSSVTGNENRSSALLAPACLTISQIPVNIWELMASDGHPQSS